MPRDSRFTPEQRAEIVLAVLEGRRPMTEICRDNQVTTTTVYRWKEEFIEGGMAALKGQRPREEGREQEREIQRMRELVGELALANFAMKKGRILSTRKEGGEGFRWLVEHGQLTVKRAAFLTGLARRSTYYKPRARLPTPVDRVVREAVVEVCTERPSFGYRRVTAMVRRKLMFAVNTKAVRRIMRQEHLLLKQPRRPPRQHIPKQPGTLTVANPDEVWHMDAMYVFCGNDRWVLAHNIVDACTSEWVGFLFDRRYRKEECIKLLEQTVLERWPHTGRAPGMRLRMDNHSARRMTTSSKPRLCLASSRSGSTSTSRR